MKIDSQLKVVAAPGVERAVASELSEAQEDGDLEKLLSEQSEENEEEDAEDDTESL